jgi:hypothetical protein
MNLVQRVQDILLKPKITWPLIDAEPADTASLYKDYLMILALIPAVASFIGLSVIGVGAFGVNVRTPLFSGLVSMVVGYAASLAMVFMLALIVDALAPSFGGTRSQIGALKLVAYASTAGFLGGIASLLPTLWILGAMAGLYSIYLLYTGLPVLMKCPPDKAAAYTAVVAVCSIVAWVVVGGLLALIAPSPMSMGAASPGAPAVSIKTPGGEISVDSAKMEALAKKMEAAGKQMEKAQASGDGAAAGKAAAEILGAMTGTGGGAPIPAQELKPFLPETAGGLARESIEAQSGAVMGVGGSQARAVYRTGDQRIELSISDMGGGGLMAAAAWANLTLDREADGRVERIYKDGQRTVREAYAKDKSHGEYMLILGNGVLVEGRGDNIGIRGLRSAVLALELGNIETMKRAPKS